jgi:accessory colonization factor AcfC
MPCLYALTVYVFNSFVQAPIHRAHTFRQGERKSMGLRRLVIIVPIGNPAKITSLNDLCRDNVRIGIAVDGCLKGVWDDVVSKAGLTDQIRRNITHHADACGLLMDLIHQEKVDAIFGWNAFKMYSQTPPKQSNCQRSPSL